MGRLRTKPSKPLGRKKLYEQINEVGTRAARLEEICARLIMCLQFKFKATPEEIKAAIRGEGIPTIEASKSIAGTDSSEISEANG